MTEPFIISIQVGQPRTMLDTSGIDRLDPEWTSGIFKEPIDGPVHLGSTGLEGDGQADLTVHGGPHQAVLFYSSSHYPDWRSELGLGDLANGAFGENVTVRGQSEATVCIGDRYQIGEALVEVSQPRRPCWKVGRRHGIADLPQRIQRTGRGGWYVRVLREGAIQAGQPIALIDRPHPEWTVARANDIMMGRERDHDLRMAFAACPALSPRWKSVISGSGPDRVS